MGQNVLLGAESCPHDAVVAMPGEFFRIPVSPLLAAAASSRAMQRLFLRYVQAFIIQTSSTMIATGSLTMESRLARWILMCHDRVSSDEIAVTHESLAAMLSVRRPGMTIAIQVLEGDGLIRATRGAILIKDRVGLERLVGDSYGAAELEYERLIGVRLSRSQPLVSAEPENRLAIGSVSTHI